MTGMFRQVGRLQTGYEPEQVESFFDHARRVYEGDDSVPLTAKDVRMAAFDLVRGGYDPVHVDAALDRLERAFVSRQRTEHVATHGQQAWMDHLAAQARTLYGRLTRPDGDRFARAPRGEAAYDPEDVDALCHRLVDYFDHGHPLTSDEVRNVTFRRRSGRRGYAEPSVDAFCARAVEVLLGVE